METKSFQIDFLSADRAEFSLSPNGFLMLRLEGAEAKRVIPAYAFPLECTDGYVGIRDAEGEELGVIRALSDFPEEQAQMLRRELDRRYYSPKLKKILSIKNKAGLSLWTCVNQEGKTINITLKDAYKSIIRVTDRRFFVVDRDGARYEIEDTEALDRKSFHRLELYL